MLIRASLLLILCTFPLGFSYAQDSSLTSPENKSNPRSDSKVMVGSPEAEMLDRQRIKAAEKEQEDNLERAREAAQLSTELRDTFARSKVFSSREIKKLERLEKITRRIRGQAGGSDGEVTIENPPKEAEQALVRLAEISEKMRQIVEKTSRHVVNAAVIERANEALEIVRYLRTLIR